MNKSKLFAPQTSSEDDGKMLVGFYGISTIVGYLIPNPVYIYIYIRYIWFVNILLITFLNESVLIFLHTVKWFQVLLLNTNNSIYY